MSKVIVLYNGYSEMKTDSMDQINANCSCTLIKGIHNIIIDSMTAWDAEKIISGNQPLKLPFITKWDTNPAIINSLIFAIESGLQQHNLSPDNIQFLVSTHGHSDHIGNNNLFLKAKHIVGYSISSKDCYYIHPFDKGVEYVINNEVKIIPTPGHTLSDVSVLVSTNNETIAVTGDLFEKFEDIDNPSIWIEAGSEDPIKQRQNRCKIAEMSDCIIPGHGPMFRVTNDIRETLRKQIM